MGAHDEIGPVGIENTLPAWRLRQVALEIKGLADSAVHHTVHGGDSSMMVARRAIGRIKEILRETGAGNG